MALEGALKAAGSNLTFGGQKKVANRMIRVSLRRKCSE